MYVLIIIEAIEKIFVLCRVGLGSATVGVNRTFVTAKGSFITSLYAEIFCQFVGVVQLRFPAFIFHV